MRHSAGKLFLIFALAMAPASGVLASDCSLQISQLKQILAHQPSQPDVTAGSAPQSVGAQLDRQPTPASMAQAKQAARADVEAVLNDAQRLDAQGQASACEETLGKARLMLNP